MVRPPDSTLSRLFWYFAEAGAFVFGSGLAIVPFLHGGVVNDFGWLNERQFLDAVAVAMITPGPVVITVAFIGYLVAGRVGASLAALGDLSPLLFVCHHPRAVLSPACGQHLYRRIRRGSGRRRNRSNSRSSIRAGP